MTLLTLFTVLISTSILLPTVVTSTSTKNHNGAFIPTYTHQHLPLTTRVSSSSSFELFFSSAPSSWSDELAIDYETRVEPVTSSFVDEMLRPFIPSTSSLPSSSNDKNNSTSKCLLDVGCGTGYLALHASDLGFRVTAIDNSPTMVSRLLQRVNSRPSHSHSNSHLIECKVADGGSLPTEWSNRFDVVTCAFSIIFFPDPLSSMKELYRCCKSDHNDDKDGEDGDGKIVVAGWGDRGSSPAFRIIPDAMRMVAPDLVEEGGRKKPFIDSPKKIAQMMERVGFADVEVIDGIERTMVTESAEEYYERFALGSPPTVRMMEYMKDTMEDEGCVDRFKETVMRLAVERGGGNKDGPIEIVSPAYFVYGTKR